MAEALGCLLALRPEHRFGSDQPAWTRTPREQPACRRHAARTKEPPTRSAACTFQRSLPGAAGGSTLILSYLSVCMSVCLSYLILSDLKPGPSSTTRSKGEKRREKNIILKCGPSRKTRRLDKIREIRYILSYRRLDKERNTTRCRDNRRTRNRRTVECVGSTSSLLGVWW